MAKSSSHWGVMTAFKVSILLVLGLSGVLTVRTVLRVRAARLADAVHVAAPAPLGFAKKTAIRVPQAALAAGHARDDVEDEEPLQPVAPAARPPRPKASKRPAAAGVPAPAPPQGAPSEPVAEAVPLLDDNDAEWGVRLPIQASEEQVQAFAAQLKQAAAAAAAKQEQQPGAAAVVTAEEEEAAHREGSAAADPLFGRAPAAAGATSSGGGGSDPWFGGEEDMAGHRSNQLCWQHFDFGMLDHWDGLARVYCAPRNLASLAGGTGTGSLDSAVITGDGSLAGRSLISTLQHHYGDAAAAALGSGAAAGDGKAVAPAAAASTASWLVCRVTQDQHLPAPTAPHTICDGANVVLDLARLTPSTCVRFRPGYKCDGPPVFWSYDAGSFSGACDRRGVFTEDKFPADHLRDIFWSFQGSSDANGVAPVTALTQGAVTTAHAPITLLVTRERGEHANLFHATTDMINAFYILHVTGVIDGTKGDRAGMANVGVVLLDEQSGPFEEPFWQRVFSPNHPVQRVSALRDVAGAQGKVRFPRALFVPPGYTNFLLAHVMTEHECHAGTQLVQAYRRFVLSGAGLLAGPLAEGRKPVDADTGNLLPVVVTFVSRRPYSAHGIDHPFMGRQIDNEEAVMEAMSSFGAHRVAVKRVDFAGMDVQEQLRTAANTEIMVAMHGAALTYPLYMPSHGGVIELWPKATDIWRCFEHIATLAGLSYERWANPNPLAFRSDQNGDYTTVDVGAFKALFDKVLADVEKRRAALPA